MGRKRLPPDDPREWLNRARSSLACAKAAIAEEYLEDLCYQAQQAAEKSIKAVFLHRGLTVPFIHDLARLLTLLENSRLKVPKYVHRAEPSEPLKKGGQAPRGLGASPRFLRDSNKNGDRHLKDSEPVPVLVR